MGYRRSFPKGIAFLCLLVVILATCIGGVDGFRSRRALSAYLERRGRGLSLKGDGVDATAAVGGAENKTKKEEAEDEYEGDYAYGTGTRKETLSEKDAEKLKEGDYQGAEEEYSYEDDAASKKEVKKADAEYGVFLSSLVSVSLFFHSRYCA
jgi:hypothetical protein